jgi:hypothetical protein
MNIRAIGVRTALVAILVGAVLVGVRAAAQVGASNSPAAGGHSVVVVGPNSPYFDELLERWFPGASGVNYFERVKPLLAIVRNNTMRVVKAYVVKWTITNADGSTTTEYQSVVSEPGPGDAQLTGERTVLGHGGSGLETEIVSPYFHWPQNGFPGLIQGNGAIISFQSASLRPLSSNIQSATRIRTILDGAIFGDGVFVGPDTSGLYERFQARQQAEADEAEWVLNQLSAGVTDQELRDSLSEHIHQGRNSTGTDPAGLSTAARGEGANRFLSVLEERGQKGLREFANRLASARKLTLQRQGGG